MSEILSTDQPQTIAKSAFSFLSGTMVSRVTGLVRDMSMACFFGTSPSIAAFFVALRFAILIRRILGEGALLNGFGVIKKTNRVLLYETCIKCLGTDVTPNDTVSDEVACAETVNAVYKKAFGKDIGGGASTTLLYKALLNDSTFEKITAYLPGDIIISPTGYGNGSLAHGHTGYMGENGKIMSNNSNNGLFIQNYTIGGWNSRYKVLGGYPEYFFRKKDTT